MFTTKNERMRNRPRLQYLKNKTTFSNRGVIFVVENGAVRLGHWPYCGMNAKVCRRLAEWLLKRADDLDAQKGEGEG